MKQKPGYIIIGTDFQNQPMSWNKRNGQLVWGNIRGATLFPTQDEARRVIARTVAWREKHGISTRSSEYQIVPLTEYKP